MEFRVARDTLFVEYLFVSLFIEVFVCLLVRGICLLQKLYCSDLCNSMEKCIGKGIIIMKLKIGISHSIYPEK